MLHVILCMCVKIMWLMIIMIFFLDSYFNERRLREVMTASISILGKYKALYNVPNCINCKL